MKAFFVDIRHGDLEAVRARLDRTPELVGAVSKGAPKSDDGQSPLQVAVKTGHVDIAHLLLDRGADVGFHERSAVNAWTVPVLHDALRAAATNSRYLRQVGWGEQEPRWEPARTREQADGAYAVLLRIVEAGADVNAPDSFGNRPLDRAVLDARDVLPSYHHDEPEWVDPMPLADDLVADLERIFRLLLDRGADLDAVNPQSGMSVLEEYRDEPVERFLRRG